MLFKKVTPSHMITPQQFYTREPGQLCWEAAQTLSGKSLVLCANHLLEQFFSNTFNYWRAVVSDSYCNHVMFIHHAFMTQIIFKPHVRNNKVLHHHT